MIIGVSAIDHTAITNEITYTMDNSQYIYSEICSLATPLLTIYCAISIQD